MKAKHPEAILLSRVGDFYEAYGEDAETIARALQIALTLKEAGGGKRVAMAGVPHHALDGYLAKLVQQRLVVALAEQLEVPVPNSWCGATSCASSRRARRSKINCSKRNEHNYLAARSGRRRRSALAHADVSTGYCAATALSGETRYDDVLAELARLDPAEIVADVRPSVAPRSAVRWRTGRTRIVAPPLDRRSRRGRAGRSTGSRSTNRSRSIARSTRWRRSSGGSAYRMANGRRVRPPAFYSQNAFLALDANTRKHLELHQSAGQQPRTRRCLRRSIVAHRDGLPHARALALGSAGLARRDRGTSRLRRGLRARRRAPQRDSRTCCTSASISSVSRKRFASGARCRATSRRCGGRSRCSTRSATRSSRLGAAALLLELVARLDDVRRPASGSAATLVDEPPATLADGGVIRPEALARPRRMRRAARRRALAPEPLEERERERTGITPLEDQVRRRRSATRSRSARRNAGGVPADYVRRQTLTNGERYVTPELRELDAAIAGAQARQQRIEADLFEALLERIVARRRAICSARPTRSRTSTSSRRSRRSPANAATCARRSSTSVDDRHRRRPPSGRRGAARLRLRPERSPPPRGRRRASSS